MRVPRTYAVVRSEIDSSFQQLTDQAVERETQIEAAAEILFAYWAAKTGRQNNALYDRQRASRLRARLVENDGNLSELLYAVDGALRDDHLTGRSTSGGGKKYLGIETLFRDRAQVERLSALMSYRMGQEHPLLVRHRSQDAHS